MAERPAKAPRPVSKTADELAVKCDLCRSYDVGPACVQACPTAAIFRIDPSQDLAELRGLFGRAKSPSREPASSRLERIGPSMIGAAIASIAIGAVGVIMQSRGSFAPSHGLGYASGIAAAAGFVALLGYAAPKRAVRLWMRRRGAEKNASQSETTANAASRSTRSITAPQLIAHLVLGLLAMSLAIAHAPHPFHLRGTSGGALYVAFLAAGILGIFTTVAYAIVPVRLSRIERTALLPEDFATERVALSDRLFRGLTGKSDVVKKLSERMLLPYAASIWGPLVLLASGRDLRGERAAVRSRIDRILEGRGRDRLAGLDDLVRVVVELRALRAQRFLMTLLRVGLPLHIGAFSIATVLLLLHLMAGVGR